MTTDHRKKAKHNRNGRSRYEKGRQHYTRYPSKKMTKGKRGSDKNNPEKSVTTFADFWPERNSDA